ncbi:penicillin acylase family protein [candidate division KSB1 bacterium]|nr:penicillin acylase family protein [candidate division KSB1 bacterium]
MTKVWRIFLSISAFFLIIITTIAILSYRLLNKSLPKMAGSMALSILNQPVEVYRDEYGVPHIFAGNESDLFRAAGFVAAQDRLWQMDFSRRVANGQLSEIFGETTVEHDKFVRIWGFKRTAEKIVEILSPESLLALKSYAEGVNAFIESHSEQLPIEFSLLKYKPEKWKIEDSIAFVRLMGWKLSFSWYTDLVLQELVAKLGEKKTREVFPDFPKDGPFILPSSTRPFWTQTQNFINSGMQVQAFLGFGSTHLGSNSWVVAGEKSACGKPLLANDPHLELRAPSVWYEMHLSGGEINVAGVSFPGVPGIVIGHNEHIAWGLTNGMIDDVDFYLEKINPDSTSQYLNGSRWQDFETVTEEIRIKDAEPESLQIRFSRNGPIISEVHPMLENGDEAVSMRWVGHEPSDELLAYLKVQKSKSWDEFTEALRHYKVPAQNFVFAAANGDIGYYLAGGIPLRSRTNGVLPHEGWKSPKTYGVPGRSRTKERDYPASGGVSGGVIKRPANPAQDGPVER